ncbi:MAG TPA: hypothetical protein VHC97_11605 [Thermoanaerobaculia bacterium]|jgi:hypothetical protein|nr:hypothetical protein [Thermoanaerobaculia bacterium]
MKSREYERRRRSIEEQLQADLELIRAGYQAKLRALETIWLSSAEGDGEASAEPSNETVLRETVPGETVLSETVQSAPPASEAAFAVRRGDPRSSVDAVLQDLPEVFEKRDIFQALGYKIPRATLYRVLSDLQMDKKIAIAAYSQGGRRTQYRKVTEP